MNQHLPLVCPSQVSRSPSCESAKGTTLLHVAARLGSLQIVKDLVRRGFDPNTIDNAGWTALHVVKLKLTEA